MNTMKMNLQVNNFAISSTVQCAYCTLNNAMAHGKQTYL
jgi:hypothetical protein